jgi:hypothetical protein
VFSGGGGGIRTPETLSSLTVFKTAGFNRSPTPPLVILTHLSASVHFAFAQSFPVLFLIAVAAYSKLCSGDDVGPYSSVKTVHAKILAVYGEDFSDAFTLSNPNECRISKVHRTVGVLAHQLAHPRNVS